MNFLRNLESTCIKAEQQQGRITRIVNAMEEHCEFAQVCSKYVRFLSGDKFVDDEKTIRDKIIDEIADCCITEYEVMRFLNITEDEIKSRVELKQIRFEGRLN